MSSAATFPTVGSVTKNPNIDPKPPVLVLVKDGPLKGRQVTLIPLDNPAALDPEIEKNKLLASKESRKGNFYSIAYIVALFVLAAIGFLLAFFVTHLLALAPIPASLVVFALAVREQNRNKKQYYESLSKELVECKQNMVKNEFKAFTRDFSNVLPLDQLLKTNRLFKRAVSINFSELEFQQRKDVLATDLKNLREEIQALQV